ncbi:Alpha/Beta hydrolase protein [Aspergillus crustosus]
MATMTEFWLPASNDLDLFVRRYTPVKPSQAKLIFLHGYDHHSGIYDEFFHRLAAADIEVVAYDLRGFGKSINETTTPPGSSGPTATSLDDLSTVISSELSQSQSSLTHDDDHDNHNNDKNTTLLFIMGHSMGGAIAFTYSSLGPPHLLRKIHGWLGESPDFGLPPDAPARPSALKYAFLAACIISRLGWRSRWSLMRAFFAGMRACRGTMGRMSL